jgi:hypothetical protein
MGVDGISIHVRRIEKIMCSVNKTGVKVNIMLPED